MSVEKCWSGFGWNPGVNHEGMLNGELENSWKIVLGFGRNPRVALDARLEWLETENCQTASRCRKSLWIKAKTAKPRGIDPPGFCVNLYLPEKYRIFECPPSATLFITFFICQVNANPSEFINFLKSGPFSPGETDLRAISSPTSDRYYQFQHLVNYSLLALIHNYSANSCFRFWRCRIADPQLHYRSIFSSPSRCFIRFGGHWAWFQSPLSVV